MTEIIRTTKLKLNIDPAIIHQTLSQWVQISNSISQIAFSQGLFENSTKLQEICYYQIKSQCNLNSQVIISAIRQVVAMYKSMKSNDVEIEKPIVFKKSSALILQGGNRGRDFSITPNGISLSTSQGRIKNIPFSAAPNFEYMQHWNMGDGKLFIRHNKVYLAISYSTSIEAYQDIPADAIIGVDRGINYLAVGTDGKKQLFFNSKRIKNIKNKYQKTRSSLQQKKAQKNTQSIRRVQRRQSGKESRFMKDINHCVSKAIVRFALNTGNPIIALEDLEDIRKNSKNKGKSLRAKVHQWSYYQLEQFIQYKSEENGLKVVKIDPAYTSQGCSKCGYIDKANRNKHTFKCKACGYELHADLNAARNIRSRAIIARQEFSDNALLSTSA